MSKFKVGDRVIVKNYTYNGNKFGEIMYKAAGNYNKYCIMLDNDPEYYTFHESELELEAPRPLRAPDVEPKFQNMQYLVVSKYEEPFTAAHKEEVLDYLSHHERITGDWTYRVYRIGDEVPLKVKETTTVEVSFE